MQWRSLSMFSALARIWCSEGRVDRKVWVRYCSKLFPLQSHRPLRSGTREPRPCGCSRTGSALEDPNLEVVNAGGDSYLPPSSVSPVAYKSSRECCRAVGGSAPQA